MPIPSDRFDSLTFPAFTVQVAREIATYLSCDYGAACALVDGVAPTHGPSLLLQWWHGGASVADVARMAAAVSWGWRPADSLERPTWGTTWTFTT